MWLIWPICGNAEHYLSQSGHIVEMCRMSNYLTHIYIYTSRKSVTPKVICCLVTVLSCCQSRTLIYAWVWCMLNSCMVNPGLVDYKPQSLSLRSLCWRTTGRSVGHSSAFPVAFPALLGFGLTQSLRNGLVWIVEGLTITRRILLE